MAGKQTQILTALQPDKALVQDAKFKLDAPDRQYIDSQITGVQRLVADNLVNGVHCTYFTASEDLDAGDVVCSSGDGWFGVLRAIPEVLAGGQAIGVVVAPAKTGSRVRAAMGGLIGPWVTGLTPGAGLARVSALGRVERVTSLVDGDIPIGAVDAAGVLSFSATSPFQESIQTAQGTLAPVLAATTGPLPANTYSGAGGGTLTADVNGTFPLIDGETIPIGGRILAKNEANEAHNGWMVLVDGGSGSAPWVARRSSDANSATVLVGRLASSVQGGAENIGRTLVLVTPPPISLGTTPLRFVPQQSEIDFDLFGGIGDADLSGNGTDNSPKLGAALLALAPGGTLRLGPFIYALDDTPDPDHPGEFLDAAVTLAQSNVTLEGHAGATRLIAKAGSDYDWIIQRTAAGSALKLRDLIFDANGANRGGNLHNLGCIRIVVQDDWCFDNVTVCNTLATIGGEAVGAQILGSRGSHVHCKAIDCGKIGLNSDGFYVSGGEVHAVNYTAERCSDTGHVFQNCSNSSLVGFTMMDCQAGFAIGPGISGGGDQYGVVVGKGVIGCTIGANAKGARPITGATTATPVVIHSPAHGLGAVNRVYISGVKGMPEVNGIRVATIIDANNYSIADIVGTPIVGAGTYVSGGYGQPTVQGVGFDLGTYGTGAALADELRDVLISDVTVDTRTNIGVPAISLYAANDTVAPVAAAITGASNATPIVVSVASTTIASGSDGVSLPLGGGALNVASVAGFAPSGVVLVTTDAGVQTVTYTGISGLTFTGCNGGTGTMSTGGLVGVPVPVNGQIVATYGVVGNGVANGRFKAASVTLTSFALHDMNDNPVAGTGAYSSGGYWQATARTRNVTLHNVKTTTENVFSYAAYINNVENFRIINCDFKGDSNPTTKILDRCVDVSFRRNLVESQDIEALVVNPGCHRIFIEDNLFRGKDGVSVYGPVFADTSTEVYLEGNLCTGSSMVAASGSTPKGVFTGATVIRQRHVDLETTQTVGGAKTFSAAAAFGATVDVTGHVGVGIAHDATVPLVVKGGNNVLAADLAAPAAGTWGIGFAGGVYGALYADINTANLVRLQGFVGVSIGTATSFGGSYTEVAHFSAAAGAIFTGALGQSGGAFSLAGNAASTISTTSGKITINPTGGLDLKVGGITVISIDAAGNLTFSSSSAPAFTVTHHSDAFTLDEISGYTLAQLGNIVGTIIKELQSSKYGLFGGTTT